MIKRLNKWNPQIMSGINERYSNAYSPKVNRFFAELESSQLPESELNCVPGLFLPCAGEFYDKSLIRIAFIGKETYYWNGSLRDNLKEYKTGKYDIFASQNLFRANGPQIWRNSFWWYVAECLASAYGLKAHDIFDQTENPLIKSFAWGNSYNIESWQSGGVDTSGMNWSTMNTIQEIAQTSNLSDFETFIQVFKPHLILHLFKNNNDSKSFDIIRNAEFIRDWGTDGFLKEYKYNDIVILHTWHPSYLSRQSMQREDLAMAFRDALMANHFFKPLGGMKYYTDMSQCENFLQIAIDISEQNTSKSNQGIAREIVTAIALELRKQSACMSAVCLVSILNTVNTFVKTGWIYSPIGRGPCNVVRGVYNYLANNNRQVEADYVATSFTKVNGEIAWQ